MIIFKDDFRVFIKKNVISANAFCSGGFQPLSYRNRVVYAGCVCVQVARRFLAAVEECSGPDLNMGLFISCDPGDVLRQADDSTRRYQQGACSSRSTYSNSVCVWREAPTHTGAVELLSFYEFLDKVL